MRLDRDMKYVADLIERSFSLQNDVDGQAFLQEMRRAAKASELWGGLDMDPQEPSTQMPGFVWVEDGTIVGNVSLIRFSHHAQNIYLLANVAVEPQYRRRGIARALTCHAIEFLHAKHQHQVWLQVNRNNQAAQDLYTSLGFHEVCCRSTWHRPAGVVSSAGVAAGQVASQAGLLRRRKKDEWPDQQKWFERLYPDNIIWHYPLWLPDFSPQVLWRPERWEKALNLRHWTLLMKQRASGFITWQRTSTFADILWLAPDPDVDLDQFISHALSLLPPGVGRTKPLALDLPCEMAAQALEAAGFSLFRSLVWMKLA